MSPPQKIFENLSLKPCNLVYSLKKIYLFSLLYFFSYFLVFLFDERICWSVGQAANVGDLFRGEVPKVWGLDWFPSLNLQIYVIVECDFIVLR